LAVSSHTCIISIIIFGKRGFQSKDSHILIHFCTSSIKNNILCLYTSFPTAAADTLRLSTTDTHAPNNPANTLENFESVSFLLISQNTGIFKR